jgi:hypothetical protein
MEIETGYAYRRVEWFAASSASSLHETGSIEYLIATGATEGREKAFRRGEKA